MLYYLLVLYPRVGKIPVEILVHPSNATIYIDENKVRSGKNYITPGSHTFKAEKDGWNSTEIVASVSKEISTIALLPTPASEEARIEVQKDQYKREELAGIAANIRGLDLRNETPVINELPYSDISGPFKIDYGFNQDDKKTPYLIVSYSTPKGRLQAIEWLADNDADLTTLEIIFEDFINPIHKDKH